MEIRRKKQLPPCGRCDVEAMESWLESMARDGWMLTGAITFFGRFSFVEMEPQPASYRLIPAKNRGGDQPHPYFAQDMEKLGWEYVRKWEEFFIFRSLEPVPREPYSSPDSQAAELDLVKKRTWLNLLFSVLMIAGVLALTAYAGISRVLIAMLSRRLGLPYLILFYVGFFWVLISPCRDVKTITALQRKLRGGTSPDRNADWQKHARRNRLIRIAERVLVILMCTSALVMNLTEKHEQKPLAELPGEPPFATLEELAPADQNVAFEEFLDGYYTQGRGIFIPRVLHCWTGLYAAYEEDGYSAAGILDVQYLKAPTHGIAMAMAKDLTRYKFRDLTAQIPFLEDLDADYVAGGLYRGTQVVLVQGDNLICARFTIEDAKGNFTLENWLRKTAWKLAAQS